MRRVVRKVLIGEMSINYIVENSFQFLNIWPLSKASSRAELGIGAAPINRTHATWKRCE